jgi:hypothetical protein
MYILIRVTRAVYMHQLYVFEESGKHFNIIVFLKHTSNKIPLKLRDQGVNKSLTVCKYLDLTLQASPGFIYSRSISLFVVRKN